MNFYNTSLYTLLLCFLVSLTVSAQSQIILTSPKKSPTIFRHLEDEQVSDVTITTDFTTLVTEKKKPHILDATLQLENDQGFQETMDIKVELRGRNRRKVCSVPPIRLDFSKKALKGYGLSGKGDKLKLVTHCKDEYGMDYLLREYWAYRLFNVLTPKSFRVHLVNIRYVDIAAPDDTTEKQLAFMIESEEEMAARFDSKDEKIWGLLPEQVEKKSYHYMILFQYMIGNDDWGLTTPRNVSFIKKKKKSKPVIIPYDFDFSGLVNAPYAIANPNLTGKSVRDRVVMGKFTSKEDLQSVVNDFMDAKEDMLKCYEACPWMSKKSKKQMKKYLLKFYKKLEKSKKMERLFLEQ